MKPVVFFFLPVLCLSAQLYSQIDVATLKSDFILFHEATFENTAKVITPANGSKGSIVMVCGQPRPGILVSRPLLNEKNEFNVGGNSAQLSMYAFKGIDSGATDNNIVHIKGNEVFAIKNGYTWNDITPHPFWWSTIHTFKPAFPPGARNCVNMFRSSDGVHWNFAGRIDAAKVGDGDYGVPQTAKGTIGGFDRTELAADPFSGTLFISGHGDGGPMKDKQKKPVTHDIHKEVVFASTDDAKT